MDGRLALDEGDEKSWSEPSEVDRTTPHMARMYDYLLGGTANFAVDRELAEHATAALPGGIEAARANVRTNRRFLVWAVRRLAGELGIRQFLDIGTGIPNADNVHAVARQVAPDARLVYVDHDPVVLAHAHLLLRGTPEGSTAYVDADLRDPITILEQASRTLDLGIPVAVLLIGVLHYVTDDEDPYGLVECLLDAVAPGSYLVASHLASDILPEAMAELSRRHNAAMPADLAALRDRAGFTRFFAGLELLDPGVVPLDRWHEPEPAVVPMYGAIGRKP